MPITHSELSNSIEENTKPDAEKIIQQLLAIRERLLWLQACFATSLSWDLAYEADAWRERFRDLADTLRKEDPAALDRITSGFESLLFAEPVKKPTIPVATQQLYELMCEFRNQRSQPAQPKPGIPDGLQQFL